MTTTKTHSPLAELLDVHAGPCISIYLPTPRGFAEKPHNHTRFHNLLRTAQSGLPDTLSDAARDALLEPLVELATNERFWHHTLDGLAVLRSPEFFKIFKLQHAVPETTVVSDSFHIRPLLRAAQRADRFEVLAITREHVRLYQGTRDALDEIEIDTAVPSSLEAALGDQLTESHDAARTVNVGGPGGGGASIRYGIGSKSDEVDKDTERFFRVVDRAVHEHHSKRSHLPLILAALPEHHAVFRAVSHNPQLLPDGVNGNPEAFSLEQLREKAWAVVQPALDSQVQDQLDEFGSSHPRGLASDDYSEVALAALAGRVRTLLLDDTRRAPGRVDRLTGEVHRASNDEDHADDILDDLAEMTLRCGGTVQIVDAGRVPGITGIAAVFRF